MDHPIRVVTRRTGLTADTLRAWERRYRAVSPDRSEGSQRRYSDEDLERLLLLQRVIATGRTIGQIASLRTDELRALLMADSPEGSHEPRETDSAGMLLDEANRFIEALDGPGLDAVLRRGALLLGAGPLVGDVIVPHLNAVNARRLRGELGDTHARLASRAVQQVSQWMSGILAGPDPAPRIVLATTEGEPDETGILILAATAAALGWRTVYLGGNLPAESIVEAARGTGAQVLGLSFESTDTAAAARNALRAIREALSSGVAVIAEGTVAESARDDLEAHGITILPGLGEVRAFLHSFS